MRQALNVFHGFWYNSGQILTIVIIVTYLKLKDFGTGDHSFYQPDKVSSLDELPK